MLTPQRPGFQICGSVPSAVDFCGYIVQDVARIQDDILTQNFTLLSPNLPCRGAELDYMSPLCTFMHVFRVPQRLIRHRPSPAINQNTRAYLRTEPTCSVYYVHITKPAVPQGAVLAPVISLSQRQIMG